MSLRSLEDFLHTTKTVKKIELIAIQERGFSVEQLMSRASTAVLEELFEEFGRPRNLTIFCGTGNNAGDGYLVAALAANEGITVRVIEVGDRSKMSAEVCGARLRALQTSAMLLDFCGGVELDCGVIVDALLGTGMRGELEQTYRQAIHQINDASLPVIAVDVPSGLNADTGAVGDTSVVADLTVTFVAPKRGLFTGRAPACCGEIIWHSLELPDVLYNDYAPSAKLLNLDDLLDCLPTRAIDAHKSQLGHVMVVGGDNGYGGAAIMAAEACLRVGAGLITLATRPAHVAAMLVRQPEVMATAVVSGQALEPLLTRVSVLVLGPGLGRSAWSEQLLQKALAANLPTVMDADALNIIADGRIAIDTQVTRWVMTPHPGEAARLLNISVREVEADRFSAVVKLRDKFAAAVILKGPGSLVIGESDGPIGICRYGNPGMASGGMGDILSGVIGALIAQGMPLQAAAELGCCLHSSAADLAAQQTGQVGLAASDLLLQIRKLLNPEYSADAAV